MVTRAGKSKELLESGGEGYDTIQAEPGWWIYKVKDEDKVAEVPQVPNIMDLDVPQAQNFMDMEFPQGLSVMNMMMARRIEACRREFGMGLGLRGQRKDRMMARLGLGVGRG